MKNTMIIKVLSWKNFTIALTGLMATACAVLIATPTKVTLAQGALCDMVDFNTPYYEKYCVSMSNESNYYNTPSPNFPDNFAYNNNSINFNNPNPNNNSIYNPTMDPGWGSWNNGNGALCEMVDFNTPYYQNYCQSYNPAGNFNYGSNNYPGMNNQNPTNYPSNYPYNNNYYPQMYPQMNYPSYPSQAYQNYYTYSSYYQYAYYPYQAYPPSQIQKSYSRCNQMGSFGQNRCQPTYYHSTGPGY